MSLNSLIITIGNFVFHNLSILFQNKHKEAKKRIVEYKKALKMTMTTMKTKQKKIIIRKKKRLVKIIHRMKNKGE